MDTNDGFAEASRMLNNALVELDEILLNRPKSPLQLRRKSRTVSSEIQSPQLSQTTDASPISNHNNNNNISNNNNLITHIAGGSTTTESEETTGRMDPEISRLGPYSFAAKDEWNGNSWQDDGRASGASSGVESPPSDMPASSVDSNLSNIYEKFIKAIERHEIHDVPDLRTKLRIMKWMVGHQEDLWRYKLQLCGLLASGGSCHPHLKRHRCSSLSNAWNVAYYAAATRRNSQRSNSNDNGAAGREGYAKQLCSRGPSAKLRSALIAAMRSPPKFAQPDTASFGLSPNNSFCGERGGPSSDAAARNHYHHATSCAALHAFLNARLRHSVWPAALLLLYKL